ncbi:MAG: helix-turn-helix transcriptional regulator [Actinomycetota bacterium]|nr:helix-turn-helix transcriptional regulator [Actinomycetota bacterium]
MKEPQALRESVRPRSVETEALGRRVRELRRKLHFTQRFVAIRVGVTPLTMIRWEKGESVPSFESLLPLSAVLGVSPNFLLFGEEAARGSALDLHTLLDDLAEQFGVGADKHLEDVALKDWPPQMQMLVCRLLELSRNPTTQAHDT